MNLPFIKPLVHRGLLLFIVAFIIILPIRYYFLPESGEILRPLLKWINGNFTKNLDGGFHSDSWMMVSTTLILFLLSFSISIIWIMIRRDANDLIVFWLNRIAAYYLSLTLLIYGLNKLFKYQFFFPEPNTLHTQLGQLSPDILYWSSMGTSYSYSLFAGLIEILPAILLLFRKTRLLGALIAFAVLINVMMINIGFGIEVKTYTGFLILLSLILLQPHFQRFYALFIQNTQVSIFKENAEPKSRIYKKTYPFLKIMFIGILLFESLGPYLETGYFNGDTVPKTNMHGAYLVGENDQNIKRLFFHSKGYFILQDNADDFTDYKMVWRQDILTITDYEANQTSLNLITNSDDTYRLSGMFFDKFVNWNFERVDLKQLPIYNK